jgi:hypothetical protein
MISETMINWTPIFMQSIKNVAEKENDENLQTGTYRLAGR